MDFEVILISETSGRENSLFIISAPFFLLATQTSVV